ncbi:MAG TPA: SMP-30/gluconolactonase/LRE family protein [Gemmatimonadaceae bacterium]|nr:SMP-30/gluconolactonase/LRE family protein [Gemmatimonadaceae bacterium]
MNRQTIATLAVVTTGMLACAPTRDQAPTATASRLPTGAHLDPAGHSTDVGSLPLAAVPAPNGKSLVLLLNGWRQQGVQVVDRATGVVRQTLDQPAAFIGLAFSPDGHTLYASGGNQDVVYRYAWTGDTATRTDSLILEDKAAHPRSLPHAPNSHSKGYVGRRYPAGLATSPDGRLLYVAENLSDSLAVIDLATAKVRQRLPAGRYPYAVAVTHDGTVFVSAWGGHTVAMFTAADGRLHPRAMIPVARHPSALLLNHDDTRLYVTSASTDEVDVIDPKTAAVATRLHDPTPANTGEGSTPNALALSADGHRLFVAEADNNAIAVMDAVRDTLLGRIPVEWYPTALLTDTTGALLVVNGKGHGTAPNPTTGPVPGRPRNPVGYTLGQLSGTLSVIASPDTATLAAYTARVAHANGWDTDAARSATAYPPIRHVVYIIKENRTYDQLFGDLAQADGDTAIVFFGRAITPNHHALAERFGIWDRFFVNAEVSADGHNWSTAAYATDYNEKTLEENYSGRGRSYDYEGTNRDTMPPDGDDANAPAMGYLWDLAVKKGVSLRDYGEFVVENGRLAEDGPFHGPAVGDKPALSQHTNPAFPPFNLSIPDQRRADVWIAELGHYAATDSMPALEIVHLGNDHTSAAAPHKPTPRAYVADNDLALGRMIDALSHTPMWKSTVVFVLEDDAQSGADHVDSHRSPLLVISPYSRRGVTHRFANTTDVLATMEEILGLGALSQFDHFGRPLRDAFTTTADTTPYTAVTPSVPLDEMNPDTGALARLSRRMNFHDPDRVDDALLNSVLWRTIKGPLTPEPPPRRASTLDMTSVPRSGA